MTVSTGGQAAKETDWYGGHAECPFAVHKDGLLHPDSQTQVGVACGRSERSRMSLDRRLYETYN